MTEPDADLIIVGAGAAGLCAAVQVARARPGARVILLDAHSRPGAKLLVSGGGRCNIGHAQVGAEDFFGATPSFIRQVLRALPPREVRTFFNSLGLPLVEDESGRFYPASQRAADVLAALQAGLRAQGVQTRFGWPVERVAEDHLGWRLHSGDQHLVARRVLLATGGCSLPKSGSDGAFFAVLEGLRLELVKPLSPALSPLRLPDGHPLLALRGVACPARVKVEGEARNWQAQVLLTHFGLSGPAVLDASRHLLRAMAQGRKAALVVDWLPDLDEQQLDRRLCAPAGARRVTALLGDVLPQRLALCLAERAGVAADLPLSQLDRARRRRLLQVVKADALPVVGARSWHHAECTAGGLDTSECHPDTLELRRYAGLYAAGEMLDVDGRLGGFNFHWAWASATVAARAVAAGLLQDVTKG